ncbi:hypothetical protein [Acinetobacter pittii]|uniref:hypothetical protein n=1 Tax=Acinetobacter pittii TaxID=48296 RepID=UPI00356B6433
MDKKTVKEIALANGFKLKEQPDGALELNPYVYVFADKLVEHQQAKVEELKASHHGEVIGHEVHFKKIKQERDELQTLYTQQGINMLKMQKRVDAAIKCADLNFWNANTVKAMVEALKGEEQ